MPAVVRTNPAHIPSVSTACSRAMPGSGWPGTRSPGRDMPDRFSRTHCRRGRCRRAGSNGRAAAGSSDPAEGSMIRRRVDDPAATWSRRAAEPSSPAVPGPRPSAGWSDRTPGRRSSGVSSEWRKMSLPLVLRSSGTSVLAAESKATRPPPAPMLGLKLSPSPWVPSSATLTLTSVPLSRSKRKMSRFPLVSSRHQVRRRRPEGHVAAVGAHRRVGRHAVAALLVGAQADPGRAPVRAVEDEDVARLVAVAGDEVGGVRPVGE